eukprot:m.504361 g.504361  ORF g.504361 m.504361 type:complete len:944 (-) comp21859_c0_seq1:276-3107(-)
MGPPHKNRHAKKAQPNIARFQRGLERLVGTADSTIATGATASGTGSVALRGGKSATRKKRKGSRKEERKNARNAKKLKNLTHHMKKRKDPADNAEPSTVSELPKKTRVVPQPNQNRKRGSATAQGDSPHPIDDGTNSLFFDMLRKDGLLEGNANGGVSKPGEEDEDDRTIREMRKLLKLKNDELKDEGDGLDFIMGYKNDVPEEYKTILKEEDDDMLNDEEDDEEFEDYLGGMGLDTYPDSDEDASGLDSNQGDIDLDVNSVSVNSGDHHDDTDGEDSTGDVTGHHEERGSDGEGEHDGEAELSAEDSGDTDDGSDGTEERKPSTPAQYITRADAYGDQSSGTTDAAKSLMAHQRYVPPAQRLKLGSAGDGKGASLQASRQVKGLLNRLNAANMTKILKEIEMVYRQNSRNEITKTITTFVLDACMNKAATLEHLLMVYAGSVAALHHVIGVEVTGHFLQDLATQYTAYYSKALTASKKSKADRKAKKLDADSGGISDEFYDKECANLATLLSYLYCYRVVHSTLVMDVLKMHCESFTDLDVELLLVILKTSGARMRGDDPEALRVLFQAIARKAGTDGQGSTARASSQAKDVPPPAQLKPRVRFMIDTIADLKSNRRKLVKGVGAQFDTLHKAIRSFAQVMHATIHDPLRIPWDDLLNAADKGRWWLVGSAWAGRSQGAAAAKQGTADSLFSTGPDAEPGAQGNDADAPSAALVRAAAKQRMNTDARRKIFYIIMGSEDYMDAYEKLVRLKLTGKQDREIVRVLVDCCLHEKVYNPYYAILAIQLCRMNHNHKFTLQYSLWDRYKDFDAFTVPQLSHLARFTAHVVMKHALSLAILKVVEFNGLTGNGLLHFQLLLVTLLTHYSQDDVVTVFDRISTNKELQSLKSAMLVFMRHYVKTCTFGIGNGTEDRKSILGAEDKKQLIKQRVKLARTCLSKGDMLLL